MRVNFFSNEVIVQAGFLGLVFMNIDLPKLATPTNLDDARARIDKPLFTFAVALLDDSVKGVDGVRLILNRQGSGPLISGQTFLQCELGILLPGPWTRQQCTIHNLHLWLATTCASASLQGGDIGQAHDGHRVALASAVSVKHQNRHLAAPTLCQHISNIGQKVHFRG